MFLARSALIFASSDGPGSAFSPRRHKGWVGRARRPSLTRASPTHIVDGTYPRRARYSFPPAASSRRLRGRDLGVRSGSRRLPRGTRGEPRWRGRCLRGGARTRDATRRRDRRRAATTAGNDDDARARRRAVPRVDVAAGASSPTGATGLAFVADARPNPNRRRRDRTRVRADATRDAMRRGREDHRRARGGPLARPPRRRDPPSLASRPAPRLRRRLFPGA